MKMRAIIPTPGTRGFDYPPGKSRYPGISFMAPEKDAKILVLIGKAQWDIAVDPATAPDQPANFVERKPVDVIAAVMTPPSAEIESAEAQPSLTGGTEPANDVVAHERNEPADATAATALDKPLAPARKRASTSKSKDSA